MSKRKTDKKNTELKDQKAITDDTTTTSAPPETPVIDDKPAYDEYTIDNVKGIIVALAPGRVVWGSSLGSIKLSTFTGKLSMQVSDKLSDIEYMDVISGLYYGNIIHVDKEIENTAPFNIPLIDPELRARINIFLDEKNLEIFSEKLDKIYSKTFISNCLEVEKYDRSRSKYISALINKLKEL